VLKEESPAALETVAVVVPSGRWLHRPAPPGGRRQSKPQAHDGSVSSTKSV
jgi:hypothetical protein